MSGTNAFILNTGDISGDVNGINFGNGGESSGTLLNSGTIASDSRAVNVGGDGVAILNFGSILGTDDQRNGTVYIDGSADNFFVANFRRGVIDAGEGNQGAGIAAQIGSAAGDEVSGNFVNRGVIQGRGQAEAESGLAGDGLRFFTSVTGEQTTLTTFEGNITNSGKILSESNAGATAAIRFSSGVAFDGQIKNKKPGLIDGANNGLYFGEAEHDAEVLNFGTIQSGSRAVNINGSGVDIQNFGSILGTGNQRNGTIYADGNAEDFSILNAARATIDTGEGNNGAGISLEIGEDANDVVSASITNHGLIQGRGNAFGNLSGDGIRIVSGAGGQVATTLFEGDIINSGRIVAGTENAVADGIRFDGVNLRGDIINSGLIDASDGSGGIEILNNVSVMGNIENSGKILADEDGGIEVRSGALIGNIVNTGTIQSNSGDGIAVDSAQVIGSVKNAGLIDVTVSAIDVRTIGGDQGTIQANITNSGTLRSSSQDGINVDAATFIGNIENTAEIDAADHGIDIRSNNFIGDVLNSGTIEAELDQGVETAGASFAGDIVNSGTLESSGDGVQVRSDSFRGDVRNSGDIESKDDDGIQIQLTSFTGDIVNSGTVTAENEENGTGIVVLNSLVETLSFTGDIVNEGTVTATDGIAIQGGNVAFDGQILNTGTINGESRGVDIGGDGVDLVNSGSIVGTGDQRNGTIYVDGSANNFSIVNQLTGVIDAGEGNNGAGVSLQIGEVAGEVVSGSINNSGGLIQGRGDGAGNLQGDGLRIFSGAGEDATVFSASIANNGTIASTEEAGANGIEFNNVSFSGSIVNGGPGASAILGSQDGIAFDGPSFSGLLSNGGMIEGDEGAGIRLNGTFNASLANTGGVIAGGAQGILLEAGTFAGGLNNVATIQGGATGIEFGDGSSFTGSLSNGGNISSDGDGLKFGDVASASGVIANLAAITGDADGDGVGVAINAVEAQVGVNIGNFGTIVGDVVLGQGNDRFESVGIVNGRVEGNGGDDAILVENQSAVIDGGTGNDILTGGTFSDLFIFSEGADADIITNFVDGQDALDVSVFFDSVADAVAAARQDGADTVIDLNIQEGDLVRLLNFDVGLIDTSDFFV